MGRKGDPEFNSSRGKKGSIQAKRGRGSSQHKNNSQAGFRSRGERVLFNETWGGPDDLSDSERKLRNKLPVPVAMWVIVQHLNF